MQEDEVVATDHVHELMLVGDAPGPAVREATVSSKPDVEARDNRAIANSLTGGRQARSSTGPDEVARGPVRDVQHRPMGIRYYAYPLDPELVDHARIDPRPFMSHDPLADAWGLYGTPRPDMLYLDKCWDELQRLTCQEPSAPRPAHTLVRGAVTHTGMGWVPWISVLSPSEVDDVARDLSLIDEEDVDTCLGRDGEPLSGSDREYVLHYLLRAQEFTAHLQRRGWGLVYMIG